MAHIIVLGGGERYLPLGRSMLAGLHAAGLKWATQTKIVDGVTVTAKVAGDHDYIAITGGAPPLLSGVVKDGTVVEVAEKKYLRSFAPTENCWQYVMREREGTAAGAFNDEPQLAKAETQYADISAGMYSGLMAKCVQLLLGTGQVIKYDYRWARCHGITRALDGKLWLVEISATHGVIAIRLPMAAVNTFTTNHSDALRECGTLFGGQPSGRAFPDDIAAAITAGKVLQLLAPEEMADYFDKSAFSSALGWSFNADGTEAQNTAYLQTDTDCHGYLYRLTITITGTERDNVAEFTEVESGRLTRFVGSGTAVGFSFSEPINDLMAPVPTINEYDAEKYIRAPILVVCPDGEFEVVYYVQQQEDVTSEATTAESLNGTYTTRNLSTELRACCYPTSARWRYARRGGAYADTGATEVYLGTSGPYALPGLFQLLTETYYAYLVTTGNSWSDTSSPQGAWLLGYRDGYVMFEPGLHEQIYDAGLFPPTPTTGADYSNDKAYTNQWSYTEDVLETDDGTIERVYKVVDNPSSPLHYDYILEGDYPLGTDPNVYAPGFGSPPVRPDSQGHDNNQTNIFDPQAKLISAAGVTVLAEYTGSEAGAESLWGDVPGSPILRLRESTVGPVVHQVYPALFNFGTGYSHNGAMLAGEDDPTAHLYNFLGYIL